MIRKAAAGLHGFSRGHTAEQVRKMEELRNQLLEYQKECTTVSVYSNRQDTSLFSAGIIYAVSEDDILLRSIAPDGGYDGHQTIPLSDIYMVCADGAYEKDLEKRYFAQEMRHPEFRISGNNLRVVLLELAKKTGCWVSVELCKSGNWDVQGQVRDLSDESVSIDAYDGEEFSGRCLIRLESVTRVCSNSSDERALERKVFKAKLAAEEAQK